MSRLTRGPVVAAALLVALTAAYFLWKQRRQRGDGRAPQASRLAKDSRAEAVVALFRTLETALQNRGISRPPSTPPLRHAEQLQASHHPLGPEVLSLTRVYLESRFGGIELSDASRRDFERRVRVIRSAPVTPA
jgi:hypothetical protein